ncbi:MAG: hypothetical protein H7061_04825 [Bdellovibrionaceae bacterium]|nr:hypothetical protein [Bdellovibrio sp.]
MSLRLESFILALRGYVILHVLFFVSALHANLPPGRFANFNINKCSTTTCYSAHGAVGFSSKISDLFSAGDVKISFFEKGSNIFIKELACTDFSLELNADRFTCYDPSVKKLTTIEVAADKISENIF